MQKLIKKGAVLASGTICSRILGLIRDLVLAFFLGTSDYMEAFLVAFRIPNVLRSLLAEEAVDAVTVPLISPYKNQDYFKALSGRLLRLTAVILFIFVVLGIVFAPVLLRIVVPGFAVNPAKAQLTLDSLRIVFLYLFFVGLSAHSAGVLFVRGRYALPAFTPIFLNVFLIAAAYLSFACGVNPVYTLSVSVLFAGALQLSCHLYRARDSILFWERDKTWMTDHNLRRAVKLFLPRIWAVAVYHINVLVIDTMLASFATVVGNGAIAAMYFANRFVQLPLAVVGLSISRAALPDLSFHAGNKDMLRFVTTLSFVLLAVLTLIIPAASLFLFMPEYFVVIFGSGRFAQADVDRVAMILAAYSPGIVFYALNRILIHAFYALKNTKIPACGATIALVVNIVMSVALMFVWQAAGLALASSIAAVVQFLYLLNALEARVSLKFKSFSFEVMKIVFASGVMVFLLKKIAWAKFVDKNRFLPLVLIMTGSMSVYCVMAYLLKFKVLRHLDFFKRGARNA